MKGHHLPDLSIRLLVDLSIRQIRQLTSQGFHFLCVIFDFNGYFLILGSCDC